MLAHAQLPLSVTSPNGQITVKLEKQENQLVYSVNYGKQVFLQQSELGLNTNLGDFSQRLKYKSHITASVNESYKLHNAKVSDVNYTANTLKAQFENNLKTKTAECLASSLMCLIAMLRFAIKSQGLKQIPVSRC
ncbi:glycoside hydrolase family 97 N-terminal domain-containing protein [Pseudoalteromonas sp. MEBiC 03607]|uniref:glycoside hydrolase family 97 N-terminal domain-containing protein n=1 Tax=Pseudoalteromonas sp. MEBiC 03607 TaxID=2563601 RepID=UPI0023EF5133|nr:glycoside hydrolase family 97 N-terminal domain-containing protein [Pseudoalteromonas sp. MEBiC 03607]